MAEIYSSSEASSHSTLSAEDADHIQRVLADLGLGDGHGAAAQGTDGHDAAPAAALAADTHPAADAPAHDNGASLAAHDGGDAFHISGLGDAAPAGTDSAAAGSSDDASAHAATPASTLANDAGAVAHASTGATTPPSAAADTLAGGNGMDTLWGSEASPFAPGAGATHAEGGQAAGAASGADAFGHPGTDTLAGAHAADPGATDAAALHTGADTPAAHPSHDTLDGSAATPHAGATDVFGSHSTIIGGAGNDTLAQHDASGTANWSQAGTADHGFADGTGWHATAAEGTASDHFSNWMTMESVAGGDGSDIYAMAHHAGADTADAGGATGGDYDGAFHDQGYPTGHFAPEPSAIVTFGDGYGAHPATLDHTQFHDTVYNI
ncbi:hypothetical protein [Aureimonas leprariae]|uniref:Uncharacterized protein n=1 Tax=Plantimonas leprariae TaxID=2615207 RepID=A0A7V7TVX4_9HYPH|nr:hypothetical protein [Aureimonas leprariae]KAB0679028.1 hypothetical protein F6X38_14110 [Aureimonas leprariae]